MPLNASVRDRVDPTSLTATVAVGDMVCIAVFVFGGAAAGHGFDPVGQFGRVSQTYLSFLVGWVVVAVPAGLYAVEARRTPRRALAKTIPAWVGAALVAQVLRATPLFPGNAAVAFYIVAVAVGLSLLGPWRAAVSHLAGA
jgi:hypothetical protein